MKFKLYLLQFVLAILLVCCHSVPTNEAPDVNPEMVSKDFTTWWNYNSRKINLSKDYIALDTASQVISKQVFLKMLSTGEYIGLKISTADASLKYQLYKLRGVIDRYIIASAKQFGEAGYRKYLMEGKQIPDFNYTDLNGKVYNRANTKGKIVVIKCWFINCTVCVQEMPALNTFVKEFEGRDDVLFISLAFDPETKLKAFLNKTKFDYAVIHSDQDYIQKKIGVQEYPTQIIVNREGVIVKVVNDYHDMIASVKDELAK